MQNNVNIQNKRARFEYELLDKYIAGIVLRGTEIKSIRLGKASIAESFCEFNEKGELFVINMTIEEYAWGTYYNHKPKSERKLLLKKQELKKLHKEVKNSGLTIVPLRVFLSEKGFAKMEIALVKNFMTSVRRSRKGTTSVSWTVSKRLTNSYEQSISLQTIFYLSGV